MAKTYNAPDTGHLTTVMPTEALNLPAFVTALDELGRAGELDLGAARHPLAEILEGDELVGRRGLS